MKKTLLFVSALCLGTAAFAQVDSIRNPNFDQWTNHGAYYEPTNWGTLNGKTFKVFGQTVTMPNNTVTQATGSDMKGPNTICLQTVTVFGKTAPGIAICNIDSIKPTGTTTPPKVYGGLPFRNRALTLTGICRYAGAATTDSGAVGVAMTKWIPANGSVAAHRDTIGAGALQITDSTWQHFAVPITYKPGAVAPDTAFIFLASSGSTGAKAGSKFYADSLAFDYGCTLDPNIISSGQMPQSLPLATDTLKLTAGQAYTSNLTFYIPDSVSLGGTTIGLDSVRISAADIVATGLGTASNYTITSNWPGERFGTNTIACILISGTMPSTPVNAMGTVIVTPYIYIAGSGTPSPLADTTIVKIGNGVTGTGIQNFSLGGGFNVNQNIPNPFDGSTTINFNAVGNGNIDFVVTDILGRQVYDTNINASVGANTFVFTTDLANGSYFFSMSDGKNTITKKMLIHK